MVKFITKAVCMALIAMLCVGANAQNAQRVKQELLKEKQAVLQQHSANQQQAQGCVLSVTGNNIYRVPERGTFVEDVESHADFTINSTVNGWSYIDGDGSGVYGMEDQSGNPFVWPGSSEPQAYIVFNPNNTVPSLGADAGLQPHGGSKIFACFAATDLANNDWLISRLLADPTHLSFWAKAYTSTYQERMKVGYSTTGTNQSDFTFLTASPYAVVPAAWTKYDYDLPVGTRYIAINCVSDDAFIFLVDDITIEQSGTTPDCPPVTGLEAEVQGADVKLTWTAATGDPTGYKVYDGTTLLATVTATGYVAKNLSSGEHTLGVEATYSDGCAPVKVTTTVDVPPMLNPVKNLNGNCNDGVLTLTWNEPDANGGPISDWLTYSTSDYKGGVGTGAPTDVTWAQRWSPADLAARGITSGADITKMKFVFSNFTLPERPLGIVAATYEVKIWQGGTATNPGTEMLSQDVPFATLIAGEWNEVTLNSTVEIDATQELWIGVRTNMTEGDGSPAATDDGPLIQGVNMFFYQGSWVKIESLVSNIASNWMVAALVEGEGSAPVELTRYDVYQDDVKVGDVTATTFTKSDMPDGESNYCVVAVYENGAQSQKVCKTIACGDECLPPDVTVTAVGDNALRIDWTHPTTRGEVIITQGGDFAGNSVGAGTSSIGVYHRFTPEDLAPVNGGELTHFVFAPSYSMGQGEPGHTYSIRIYQGGTWGEVGQRNPGTQIYSQDLDNELLDFGSGMENIIILDNPLIIDASQELWLGYHCTNIPSAPVDPETKGKFPAGTDSQMAKEGFGNITFLQSWRTLTEASDGGLTDNWVIKGLVQVVVPTVDIYRNGTIIETEYEGTTYADGNLAEGRYCYELVAHCVNGGTSEKSEEVCEDIKTGINEFTNSVTIYPNPANSIVTITVDNFLKVEVYNTVGQLIETKTVNSFDVSSYNTGIYLFKVYDTSNNSATRRVMVTK